MKLYEINAEIEKVFAECIDPETGEIIGDLSVLDALEIERDQKIENIGLLIKNLRADKNVIEATQKSFQHEADKYKKQSEACENRIESLKRYLLDNLHVDKFKTLKTSIWTSKRESTNITDLWKIPDEYLKYSDPKPDKDAIKKAIKDGQVIEGAELVENVSIIIR